MYVEPRVTIASNRGKTAILGWRPTALPAGCWERLPDAVASREVRQHRRGNCSWKQRIIVTVIRIAGVRRVERQEDFL
jgi:hypothetical protein